MLRLVVYAIIALIVGRVLGHLYTMLPPPLGTYLFLLTMALVAVWTLYRLIRLMNRNRPGRF